MAIALVTNAAIAGGTAGGTSASLNTTGATLLVVVIAQQGTDVTVSDSKANAWTGLTVRGTSPKNRIWYAANPTVGPGHTFTISGASTFSAGDVQAFSGVATSSPFESQNGASATASTIQAGVVTPVSSGSLIVAGIGGGAAFGGAAATIDSGFTKTNGQIYVGSTSYGVAAAYLVQSVAATVNPTWANFNAGIAVAATIAVFKPVLTAVSDQARAMILA